MAADFAVLCIIKSQHMAIFFSREFILWRGRKVGFSANPYGNTKLCMKWHCQVHRGEEESYFYK